MPETLEKIPDFMNEVLTGSSDPAMVALLSRLKREGRLIRLAPRIYTTNLTDSAENVVRRNLWTIIGRLWPGARLSHRTALEYAPRDGHVFLGWKYTRKVRLPGVTIHFIATPETQPSDYPFLDGLRVSSNARAILENLEPDKTQGGARKCVGAEAVEARLEAEFASGGEPALNRLRDDARAVAAATGHAAEFARLDKMVGALLATRPADVLKSGVALARAAGEPFDAARVDLFGTLLEKLGHESSPDIPDPNASEAAFATFAFFESYFSNYIEGTEFELEDARRIVETGVAVPTRDADSHDILGTYAVVSNRREMSRLASTPDEFLDILRERHRIVLAGRPTSFPGRFKTRDNRAGDTHFVSYDRVRGTLKRGFEMSRAISSPFSRAVFVLFVVSEVHPFTDGNGRISRVMMNAELTAAGQCKILVPTVFRPDYIGALRRLSRKRDPAPLVSAMTRLREFCRLLSGDDFEAMRRRLESANAFRDDDEAILRF